ncbi:MFS transporter [Candidatus Thiosymbion oneisti]|uniref:MFS transporter n=1 Tax=Candidatus Thiosymbion oneisti TaxID=589554 RepID=UPI000A7B74E6|nr:MFS transporter [Candidatus Thiosymbion oneisti]
MPYWRLSSFYFFYFAALGALIPFWGLYLKDRGFTPLAIGELMAILMATKIVAPNLWGWIADRTGARLSMVRLASLLTLLTFSGIFAVDGFWGIALVMALFGFFWNASLPQIEVITFNHLGPRARHYATIRLWGSIGFIIAVPTLGAAVERTGTQVVPELVLVFYAGIWLSSLAIPDPGRPPVEQSSGSLSGLMRQPEIAAFLTACFFMQVSHGAFYVFYSLYLTEAGYSSTTVGALWAWGVVLEVLVFWRMHHLLARFGARRILLVSLGLAVLRWLLTGGFAANPVLQLFAQTLHAATFGAFHAAAIHLVHHYFSGRIQGRGQALYSSLSFGAGVAVGSLLSGVLWSNAGAGFTFVLSAPAAGLGWLAVWGWVDKERRY